MRTPTAACMALADAFIVTGESMSMLGEAADTGRPLFIFDMGDGGKYALVDVWPHSYRYKPLSFRLAMCIGACCVCGVISAIFRAPWWHTGRASWLQPEGLAEQVHDCLQR